MICLMSLLNGQKQEYFPFQKSFVPIDILIIDVVKEE